MRKSRMSRMSRNNEDSSLSKNSLAFRKRTEIDIIESNGRFPTALRSFT